MGTAVGIAEARRPLALVMLDFAVKLKGSGEETGDILALRDAAYSEWGWNDGVQMPRLATEATRATLDGQVRRSTLVPTAPCTQQGTMLPSEPSFRPHTARNKGSCPAPFRIPHPAPFRIPSLPNPPPRSLPNPPPCSLPNPLAPPVSLTGSLVGGGKQGC